MEWPVDPIPYVPDMDDEDGEEKSFVTSTDTMKLVRL
jgi:hypothetical protein